MCDLLLV